MKYIFTLSLILFFISNLKAQNTLSGRITSSETGESLIATVYLPQLEKGTVADLDGQYTITNIPQGIYSVVYSLLGYSTVSKKVLFSENNTVLENVQMNESAVEIEEVIISTPFHKLQSENVMKVERTSINEMKSTGAMNLADGLSNIAGVSLISTGVGIGKPVIRGLSANRVLTYSQGVRLENQQFGDEHGLGINEAGIESVEVIKGPASLLYGSDALGGVLYINPENFATAGNIKGDVQSSYTSNTLGTSVNLGVKSSGQAFKFLIRGGLSNNSDYRTGSGYRVTNTRFNEKDLKTGVRFQNSKLKTTLRYNYNRANIGIPEEIGIQSNSQNLLAPFQEIDNHIISWENKLFLNKSSIVLKGGYTFNDRREFEEIFENQSAMPILHMKLRTFNYDAKYNLPELGKFETIVGIQGMFQTNTNFGEEILIPDANTADIGVMATSHYHLEKLDIQAGIRFDHRNIKSESAGTPSTIEHTDAIKRNFNSFNFALGAKTDISKNVTTRLNLASGYRAPNLAELASNGVHEGTNRYEIGNAALKNEQNFQTDLSVEFNNDHFEISANGFYNTIRDFIFLSPSDQIIDDTVVYNYVQGDAHLYGGEFGLHIHPHPLDWLHFESSFETVTGKLNSGNSLPMIPANTIKNTFRIEFNEMKILKDNYMFIRLESTLDQNNPGQFETSSEGYNLFSFGSGTSIKADTLNFNIGFNITNLTNESYISHLSRLKPDNIENIGRSFNLSLKLQI